MIPESMDRTAAGIGPASRIQTLVTAINRAVGSCV
jgi:hypothetical protein